MRLKVISDRGARGAGKPLKSLAYCTDAVLEAAEEGAGSRGGDGAGGASVAGCGGAVFARGIAEIFGAECDALARGCREIARRRWLERGRRVAQCCWRGCGRVWQRGLTDTARKLEEALPLLDAPGALDLEDLERRMTVLEEKLSAALAADADEEALLSIRREMDRSAGALPA